MMSRKRIMNIALIIIFILAAYFRVDFLRSVNHEMPHDAINYDAMVRQLLEDGVYAYNDTSPNAYVTPGYPLFLASIYWLVDYEENDPLPWVRYVQVLLSLITIWFIYRISSILANDITGVLAAFFAAIYPPFVWANGAILTEVLGIFFMLAYILVQINAFRLSSFRLAIGSGALLGLTVLVRPEFLPLIAVTYLFYWVWKKNTKGMLKLFLCSCIGLVCVMMPWWIRNLITLHELIITGTQVNPFAAGTYPYKNFDDGLVDRAGKTQMEVAIERLKVGFSTQPWLFIKWYTIGKLQYIYQYAYTGGGHRPFYNVIPFIHYNYIHLFLVGLGMFSIIDVLRKWKQMATLLVLIIGSMTLIRLAFIPEYRYNVTMMPLIIIIDCILIMKIWTWLFKKPMFRSTAVKG